MPKQFADFDAPRMRDNQTPRAFHSRCESLQPWEDILAMIQKLWSSSRGKRRHETVFEVHEEVDEVLGDKEDANVVLKGGSCPILHAKSRGG